MKVSANSAVTYWTPDNAKTVTEKALPPTVSTLSKLGGFSLTNRAHALTPQFRFIQQNVPSVDLSNVAPLNAFNVQNATYEISKANGAHPFSERMNFSARSLAAQKTSLVEVYAALGRLAGISGFLKRPQSFNIKSASSNRADIIDAGAGAGASEGKYKVTVNNLSRSHQVATDDAFSPDQALGLTGSIRVNGWNIDIEAADTLVSIRDKINFGEDTNHNGVLDDSEDVNGNGSLDEFSIPAAFTGKNPRNGSGYLPSFYLKEDIDGDGIIDGAEDTNGNDSLDGNSAQTGVSAHIWDDRLILTSHEPANIELRLRDPDRVLETLGVLSRDDTTAEVSVNMINPEFVETKNAVIIVRDLLKESAEDTVHASPNDIFSGAIEGVVLSLKRADFATVKVENNLGKVADPVSEFVASFNGALRTLNMAIDDGGMLSANIRMRAISADLARGFYSPPNEPKGTHGKLRTINDIGIFGNKSEPTAIHQAAFSRVAGLLRDRLALPGNGRYAFSNIAKRAGINSPDNYTASMNRRELESRLEEDAKGVGDLLRHPAMRLEKRLGAHLQPNYGTIRYQSDVADYYLENEGAAREKVALRVQVIENQISRRRQGTVFSIIA